MQGNSDDAPTFLIKRKMMWVERDGCLRERLVLVFEGPLQGEMLGRLSDFSDHFVDPAGGDVDCGRCMTFAEYEQWAGASRAE